MRNYTSANISADYPDEVVWREDNNFVYTKNLYGQYPMKCDLTLTIGGQTYTYSYTTEIGELTFRLSPLLRMLNTNTAMNGLLVVDSQDANANHYSDYVKFDLTYHYGKTLQERHHGSSRVIAYYEYADISKVDVYVPAGWKGNISYGGAMYFGIAGEQVYHAASISPSNYVNFTNTNGTAVFTGDIWDEDKVLDWRLTFEQVCPRRNGIKLTYYDTDGCKRFAIGEVLNKKMAAKRDEYHRGGVVFNEVPRSLLTGYSGTIEVGFVNVNPMQYLEDIMLSPIVTTERGGKEIEVIPTTLTLVRDGKTKDIVISFKIDA